MAGIGLRRTPDDDDWSHTIIKLRHTPYVTSDKNDSRQESRRRHEENKNDQTFLMARWFQNGYSAAVGDYENDDDGHGRYNSDLESSSSAVSNPLICSASLKHLLKFKILPRK
jgi:hypothetical protein